MVNNTSININQSFLQYKIQCLVYKMVYSYVFNNDFTMNGMCWTCIDLGTTTTFGLRNGLHVVISAGVPSSPWMVLYRSLLSSFILLYPNSIFQLIINMFIHMFLFQWKMNLGLILTAGLWKYTVLSLQSIPSLSSGGKSLAKLLDLS